jgi:uncharacterized protein (DUF952 family)
MSLYNPNKLYHMCEKKLWQEAVSEGRAYFPPTFVKDGMFTHATAVPERLIATANHFYKQSEGEWICLELSRSALLKLGIETVFEEAKPVGETSVDNTFEAWVCPHIYVSTRVVRELFDRRIISHAIPQGGIATHIEGVVLNTYEIGRSQDGTFLSIVGLTSTD